MSLAINFFVSVLSFLVSISDACAFIVAWKSFPAVHFWPVTLAYE